jgi:hypothetical protein
MITLLTGFISDMVVTTAFMRVAFGWKTALQSSVRPTLDAESNPASALASE